MTDPTRPLEAWDRWRRQAHEAMRATLADWTEAHPTERADRWALAASPASLRLTRLDRSPDRGGVRGTDYGSFRLSEDETMGLGEFRMVRR